MKRATPRRVGAGLAGMALLGAGVTAFGAVGSADAVGIPGNPIFDPPSVTVEVGSTFDVTLPITVTQEPLEYASVFNITESYGLSCTPVDDQLDVGTEPGSYELTKTCTITEVDEGASEIYAEFEYTAPDGSTRSNSFGFDPPAPEEPSPTPTESPTPDPTPEPSESPTPEPTPTSESPTPTATSESPDPTPTGTASPTPTGTASPTPTETFAPAPSIEIKEGNFDPPSAIVSEGGEFTFTKAVVIEGVPLTDDLTMVLSDYNNLVCEPTEAALEAGTAPGTYEFVFNCEFGAGSERATAVYTISGDDLAAPIVGEFGFGAEAPDADEGTSDDGKSDDSPKSGDKPAVSTEGGLADTGAPAVGVLLAGGLAAVTVGGLLMRRRA